MKAALAVVAVWLVLGFPFAVLLGKYLGRRGAQEAQDALERSLERDGSADYR